MAFLCGKIQILFGANMKKSFLFRLGCVFMACLMVLSLGGCKRKNNAKSSGLIAELSDSQNAKEAVFKEESQFFLPFQPEIIQPIGDKVVYFNPDYREPYITEGEDVSDDESGDETYIDETGNEMNFVETGNAVGDPTSIVADEAGSDEIAVESDGEGEISEGEGEYSEGEGEYIEEGYYEEEEYVRENYNCAWIVGDLNGNNGDIITYTPAGIKGAYITGSARVNSSGDIYFLESSVDPDNSERSVKTVVVLGLDGKVKKRIEVKLGEDFYSDDMCMAPDGRLLLLKDGGIIIFDENGNMDGEIVPPGNDYVNKFFVMKDDTPLTMVWTSGGIDVRSLNLETKQFDKVLYTGNEFSEVIPCSSSFDFSTKSSDQIKGYNLDGTSKTILNFPDSNLVGSSVFNYCVLDDQTVLLQINENDSGYSYGMIDPSESPICVYKKVPPEQVKDKQIITLGGLYVDNMMSLVVRFNKSSDEYQIRVVDYNQFNSESDWEGGERQLRNDMLTKTGPDIIVTSSLTNPSVYMRKGLFADLYPLMEKSGIKKEDYFQNILDAGSRNNKLYVLIPKYSISACRISTDHLNGKEGVTIREMMEMEEQYGIVGKGMEYMTRESIIENALTFNSDDYYNMDTGKCNFDSQGFKDLLVWASHYPSQNDEDGFEYYEKLDTDNAYRANKLLVENNGINNFRNLNRDDYAKFDQKMALIGFPSEKGDGTGVIVADCSLAISSKCKHKEAAFEFIKLLLSEDYQDPDEESSYSWEFPILKSSMDKLSEKAMEKPFWIDYETGEKIYEDESYYSEQIGGSVTIDPITRERLDYVIAFIEKADHCPNSQKGIINLVNEDAAAFFSGQKTVDEVCAIIQDRVSIYVGENQ